MINGESVHKVLYVGKGTGNRIFAHINSAMTSPLESDKLDKIRLIQSRGSELKYAIIRHGLHDLSPHQTKRATHWGITQTVRYSFQGLEYNSGTA
jgi:hypothetical protein